MDGVHFFKMKLSVIFLIALCYTFGVSHPIIDQEAKENIISDKTKENKSILTSYKQQKETCATDIGKCVQSKNTEEHKLHALMLPKPLHLKENIKDTTWKKSPYYSSENNVEAMRVGISHYDGNLYPHVHPELFALLNPLGAVRRLPPVYVTYIRETLPSPYALRKARMTRETDEVKDEEFMKQLAYDANMENVLPTMEVPFARGSSYLGYESAPIAVIPKELVYNCGVPLLFSCVPKISHGVFARQHRGSMPVLPVKRKELYR